MPGHKKISKEKDISIEKLGIVVFCKYPIISLS